MATAINIKPSAIIYAHSMLGGSKTFIRSHAEALQKYEPVYAGAHRVSGLDLPAEKLHVVNNGSLSGHLREYLFRQFGYAPSFVKKLRATGPAIVHTHFGTAGPSGMHLANSLGLPLLVTFHGKDATMGPGELASSRRGRSLMRHKTALIARAGAFIAVSQYVRDSLVDRGYPEAKIVVHRNGIDLDYFKPPPNRAAFGTIVFVGRFIEKKGVEYLIEASAKLVNEGHQFELVMIGDGALRSKLEEASKRAKINCRFPGFLPQDQVRDWLGAATVVAVPSVVASDGDSEGLPTILLEAQAMQAPVVATRHSGIPEGVKAGVTAELVEERDVGALADRMLSFLQSAEKVRKFGEAGRRFMIDAFDLRRQVDGLEHIYLKLEQSFKR